MDRVYVSMSVSRESLDDRSKCRKNRRHKPDIKSTDMKVIDLEDAVSLSEIQSLPSGKENSHSRVASALSRVSTTSPTRSRPGSMRPRTAPRAPSRTSVTSSKKTVPRPSKKTRPQTVAAFRQHELDSESENESESPSHARTALSDIMDFGVDIYTDQGWDTDLEQEEEKPEPFFDGSLKAVYLESCKSHNVIPASYFLRHMTDPELEMRHHCLGADGAKPISVAMVSNTTITKLDLSDNWLGSKGGIHVCEMLKENCYITHISLSDNRLALPFANKFVEVLQQNSTLSHITLAGNDFDDACAAPISDAITNTTRVEYLDLSRNKFGEKAGLLLGPAISENSSIKHLDLSWNSIRKKGAIAIAQGIKTNVLMSRINLSWNGFAVDGAKALGDALKHNSSLEELDISNNRITTEGAVLLGKGLYVNESLKTLRMGKNPMQSAGCYAVCVALLKNPNTLVTLLDFTDILVNTDFHQIFVKVKESFPDIRLKHGGDGVPKKPKARVHPMVKLKNYIDRNNLRLVDFFNKFDKDQSMSVTREEFKQGIERLGVRFTQQEMTLLLDDLDEDGDGEINYSELVMGHQDFTEKEKKMVTTIMSMKNKQQAGTQWRQLNT